MRFEFEVCETLSRMYAVEAPTLEEAITRAKDRLDGEDIVLDASDFIGGELRLMVGDNILPQVEYQGERIGKDLAADTTILVDLWQSSFSGALRKEGTFLFAHVFRLQGMSCEELMNQLTFTGQPCNIYIVKREEKKETSHKRKRKK